jgi:hypothetical protein
MEGRMASCKNRLCDHTLEEHVDAWFVSGVLLSSTPNMTSTTWSELVKASGDSWLLLPEIKTAFNVYQSLNQSFLINDNMEGVCNT